MMISSTDWAILFVFSYRIHLHLNKLDLEVDKMGIKHNITNTIFVLKKLPMKDLNKY